MPNPKYQAAQKAGRGTWGIPYLISVFEKKDGKVVVPRGCLEHIYPYFDKCEKIEDKRVLFAPNPVKTEIELREQQERAVVELLQEEEGFLRAPAGSGKTLIGLEIMARVGQPTLWLTHLDRLYKQVIARVKKFIPEAEGKIIGEIRENVVTISEFLTVGMVPSMVRMELEIWKDFFGMILVDEAHHVPASTFLEVIRQFSAYHLYGLTATDYRNDGLDPIMFGVVGSVKSSITYDELVKAGYIMRPTVKVVDTNFRANFDNVRRNLYQKMVKRVTSDNARNKLVVEKVLEEARKGKVCIVISALRKHCRELFEMIADKHEGTALAIGDIKKGEVDLAIEDLENGTTNVLVCTYEMLGEGFDLDKLERLFFTVPFRAPNRVEQGIGRLQRIASGKQDAVVYEFLDRDVSYCRNLFNSRVEVYKKLGVGVELNEH